MLDYLLPGCDIALVEHVIRTEPGREWDGPGLIHMECWDMTEQEAVDLAAKLKPRDGGVAVRAYHRVWQTWLDTKEPAWNPKVHKPRS